MGSASVAVEAEYFMASGIVFKVGHINLHACVQLQRLSSVRQMLRFLKSQ
jgi:hypothetical protein